MASRLTTPVAATSAPSMMMFATISLPRVPVLHGLPVSRYTGRLGREWTRRAIDQHNCITAGACTVFLKALLGHDHIDVRRGDLGIEDWFIIDDHRTH